MNKIMGYSYFNIRMSIVSSPPSRHMRNNTFLIQYSDEIIIKSLSRV